MGNVTIPLFGCLFLLGLAEKLANYGYVSTFAQHVWTSSYDKRFSKQGFINIHIWSFHQLMVEIMDKRPIFEDICDNYVLSLHNIRNLRDVNSSLPKTVFADLLFFVEIHWMLMLSLKKCKSEEWDSHKKPCEATLLYFFFWLLF